MTEVPNVEAVGEALVSSEAAVKDSEVVSKAPDSLKERSPKAYLAKIVEAVEGETMSACDPAASSSRILLVSWPTLVYRLRHSSKQSKQLLATVCIRHRQLLRLLFSNFEF